MTLFHGFSMVIFSVIFVIQITALLVSGFVKTKPKKLIYSIPGQIIMVAIMSVIETYMLYILYSNSRLLANRSIIYEVVIELIVWAAIFVLAYHTIAPDMLAVLKVKPKDKVVSLIYEYGKHDKGTNIDSKVLPKIIDR